MNIVLYLYIVNLEWFEYNLFNFDIYIKRKLGYVILFVLFLVVLFFVLNIFCFVLLVDFGEKMGILMVIFLIFVVFLIIINDIMFKFENIFYFIVYFIF